MRHRKHVIVLVALLVAASLMLSGCSLFLIKRNEQNINETSIVLPNSSSGEIDEPGEESEVKAWGPNYYGDALDANPTTGYNWGILYQSENLKVDKMAYTSDDTGGEILDGVGGTTSLEFHVTEGEKALLIMRYYRDWEPNLPACFRSYEVTLENGEITNVEIEEWWCNAEVVNTGNHVEDGYFSVSMPGTYDLEFYEEKGGCGVWFSPEGESEKARLFHAEDLSVSEKVQHVTMFEMGGVMYEMGFDEEENIVYLSSEERGLCCETCGASWAQERVADLIEIMDVSFWEE